MKRVWLQLFALCAAMIFVAATGAAVFGAEGKDPLTSEERAWLKAHGPVKYAPDPSFPPFEFIDKSGRAVGITPDILAKIGTKLGVEFLPVKYSTWSAVIEATKRGEVDLLGTLTRTPEREGFLLFSDSYLFVPYVLFVNSGGSSVDSMGALVGKRWGVVKGYGINAWLAEKYPELTPVPVENTASGLAMVSTGQLDAMLETLPVGLYVIREQSLSNIKMVPSQVYALPQHFGVNKAEPLLLSIVAKGLENLTQAERTEIFVSWTGQDFTNIQAEISPFWRNALFTLLAAIAIGLVWIWSLRRGIARRTKALAASEEKYRSLVELAPDTIFLGDPTGNIIGANKSAEALTGYTIDELLAMSINPLFSEEERTRVPLRYDLLREGKTVRSERWLTRKDGSLVPIDMNTTMMPDGNYQTFMRDMSERMRAEEVLRASEQKFSAAFNHAPLLMTISSLETGRYIEVNDKFCEVSGFPREEAVGRTSLEMGWVRIEDRERLIDEMRRESRVRELELELTAKDGRKVHCLYSAEMVTIEGKARLLSIALDVTEKKKLEEELDKAQRLESLGVLAGGIAHDFNNILTGILGNLTLAQTQLEESSPARKCLDECEKASMRAGQLVHQLLTFARGGAPLKKLVKLAPLINESVSFVLRGQTAKGKVLLDSDLHPIVADEGQISQALNNLIINAAQAMPGGGIVTVSAENVVLGEDNPYRLAPGPYVSVSVEDHGQGIAKENLSKIFDPYFTTKSYGTGLGLATVYSIVARHRGFIGVDSTLSRGTRFSVLLPAAKGVGEGEEPRVDQKVTHGSGRILVMDDDTSIRDLLGRMLETIGYKVECFPDGQSAIEAVREAERLGRHFDAAILDLTIPGGVGGREAAQVLRLISAKTKLLVSSGYSNDTVMAEYSVHGFDGAIPKPYKMAQLAEELARVLA